MATGPGSTVISGRKSLAERRSPCRRVTQIAGAFMLLYRVCWCTGECLFDVWLGMFNASYGMWEDSRMTSVVLHWAYEELIWAHDVTYSNLTACSDKVRLKNLSILLHAVVFLYDLAKAELSCRIMGTLPTSQGNPLIKGYSRQVSRNKVS